MKDSNNRAKHLEKSLHSVLFELLKTKSGFILLLFLIAGASLIYLSNIENLKEGVWQKILFAIGTSFIATAIFTVTQLTLTSRENATYLHSLLEMHFESFKETILDSISKRQAFTPTDIYQSSNEKNPLFKTRMLKDLSTSSNFYFKGISGKYAASQLLESQGSFENIFIILPSVSNEAIYERARIGLNNASENAIETERKNIIKDLTIALAGFFSKVKFTTRKLTIIITDIIFIDRYEITDTSLYLQMFDDQTYRNRNKFPTAFRFNSSSPIYHHYKREFISLVETCDEKYELSSNSSKDEYFSFLKKNYSDYFDCKKFEELVTNFDDFIKT